MMGGAVKRYEAAAYDERQPAPPRRGVFSLLYPKPQSGEGG